jgi:hypothetical protein
MRYFGEVLCSRLSVESDTSLSPATAATPRSPHHDYASFKPFHIDPLHPTALVCESCGEPVCSLPADAGTPERVEGLTTHQAAIAWRAHGAAIQLHAVLCG